MIKRVALVGASSTGKTTVFELLKTKLPKWEFISESTRTVQKYGFIINEAGTEATQLAIATYHLKTLLQPYNLILDRCFLDVLVYTSVLDKNIPQRTTTYLESVWEEVKEEYTHFIYFPIEFNAVEDGVRSVDEEWRHQVDVEFKNRLQSLRHLTISGSPMQRVSQITKYLNI